MQLILDHREHMKTQGRMSYCCWKYMQQRWEYPDFLAPKTLDPTFPIMQRIAFFS